MSLEPLPEDASESQLGFPEGMDGEAVEEGPTSGVSDEDDWAGAPVGIPSSDPLADCSIAPTVDRFIQECAISASSHPALSIELPWETQPFRTIFSGASEVVPTVEAYVPLNEHVVGGPTDAEPTFVAPPRFLDAIAHTSRRSRHLSDFDRRQIVIGKWVLAITQDLSASSIGQDLVHLQHDERVVFVSDALGGKATNTLSKRIGQLVAYFRWCDREHLGYFPITREKSRGYIGEARQGQGAAGRVTGFVECLTFLYHVLGFDVDLADLEDPWLKGVQRQLQAARPPRKQARPLACREVLILEEALANPSLVLQDRMACGVMLFAIYSRARASDLASLCSLEVDPGAEPGTGYIEAATFKHKSRQAGNSMGLPLLLIAPMKGLGARSWGTDFVQVSEAAGLPLSRFTDGEGPLLPAPTPEGRWGSRGVTSSELGEWMSSILASPDATRPTSHSLKATMLSMLVKWGCNPDSVLILGHHAPRQRGLSMVHTYGRDVQAAPLRELERCLADVRSGRFRPDCSRSGMITESTPVVAFGPSLPTAASTEGSDAQQLPEASAPENACEASYTTSDSDSSTSATSSDEIDILGRPSGPHSAWREGCVVHRHKRTKTLHLLPAGCQAFICGRQCSHDHVVHHGPILSSAQKCQQCETGRPIRSAEGLIEAFDRAKARRR